MGTIFTKFHYYEDYSIDENLLNDNLDNKTKYTYQGSIKYSNINCLKKNDKYKIYLCENDLVLEDEKNNYTFLYQNISHWVYSRNSFGFFLKNSNNSEHKIQIILNVMDGIEVANNLRNITTELVEYYKNL